MPPYPLHSAGGFYFNKQTCVICYYEYMALKLSIIIPTLNNSRTLPLALLSIDDQLSKSGFLYEIIITDRGSNDATKVIADRFAALLPRVKYMSIGKNISEGAAARAALLHAKGDWRVIMPAAGNISVDEFQKILPRLLSGYDLVLGSRALRRSVVQPQLQFHVRFFRILHNVAIQLTALPGIWDTESGFLCLNGSLAEKLLPKLKEGGAGWVVELAMLARRCGFRVKELPIFWGNTEPFVFRRYLECLKGAFNSRIRSLKGLY